MAEDGSELRRIAWTQAFPFVRLFRTLGLALGFSRLVLALACVLLCYAGGRVLDVIWGAEHGVAVLTPESSIRAEAEARGSQARSLAGLPRDVGVRTEIEAFATMPFGEFVTWRNEARQVREQRGFLALRDARKAANFEEAQTLLAAQSLRKLLVDPEFEKTLTRWRGVVKERLTAGLANIDKDTKLTKAERQEKRDALIDATDTLRRALAGALPSGVAAEMQGSRAIDLVAAVDEKSKEFDRAELTNATMRVSRLQQYEELKPRGPFISLVQFEERCFAGAIQGVCNGRWGFQGRALDPQPAMCGSMESALRGACWLFNQHFWYGIFYGIFSLLVLAYFGGAICRSAAVQSARDESISMWEALRFVRERFGGFVLAPLLPLGVLIGIALLMFVGGLIGTIGYIGEWVTGFFYGLALLGGFAAALLMLASVLGYHLMWPTIAVEGSDGFDALSRACSYVGSRIWHVGFYWFVLLLYGGLSFVLVRDVAALTLKLSHKFTGWGMNMYHSSQLSVGKLNAMWTMPAWADLPLLPSTGDVRFWGMFPAGPLDGSEAFGAWFIQLWVYLLVGLVAAFVVSYFFCGSTQMYFLLRREVDATDWDEVYYEETEEELPTAVAAGVTAAVVVEPEPTPSAPPPPASDDATPGTPPA